MPEPASRQSFELPVEGFDLGFEGVVTPGRMAKLLETLRWRLAREGEHPILGTFKAGVLRAQSIELDRDVRLGETLVVDLWLSRVGRTSLEFSHRLTTKTGEEVGRAVCTIVAIGESGPAPLPGGLERHVAGPSALSAPRLAPPDPAKSHVRRFRARPSDLDLFRHVNQSRYVDFIDDARHFAKLEGHEAGFDGPVGAVSVSYEAEITLGQEIEALIERGGGEGRAFALRRVGETTPTTLGKIEPRRMRGAK